jgi:hypothetical protein
MFLRLVIFCFTFLYCIILNGQNFFHSKLFKRAKYDSSYVDSYYDQYLHVTAISTSQNITLGVNNNLNNLPPHLITNTVRTQPPVSLESKASPLALGNPSFGVSEISFGASLNDTLPTPFSARIAPTPEGLPDAVTPQAQAPPELQPREIISTTVSVLRLPTFSNTGLIAVVLPQGVVNLSKPFTIPLPEQAIVYGEEIKFSIPGNEILPSWITYNPQSQAFEVTGVPIGGLPLTVVVDSGGLRTLVLL